MIENKVNLILIVFTEPDEQLFRECCIGVTNQSYPCFVSVIFDKKTPERIKNIAYEFPFDEYLYSPDHMSNKPALRHKWAYDQSQFKYIAFQQGDDQPYLSRIEQQMNVMQTSKKQLGISFGGYYYVKDKDLEHGHRTHFQYSPLHLFNVGYPSFWLLNKKLIPKLPLITGFTAPNEWEWDLFMLIEILKQTESIILQETLGIYNQHSYNSTNTHCSENSKHQRLEELKEYFLTQKSKIKNIYFLDLNGKRTDNK